MIVGCNSSVESSVEPYVESSVEPYVKSSVKSSVKNLTSTIYSIVVEAVKVNNKDYFIKIKNGSIKLEFSSNIKDQDKKPHFTFSIKQGVGNLYYTLGTSDTRKELFYNKQEDFEEKALWEYVPISSGTHELVFYITIDEGTKIQTNVCFEVRDFVMTTLMKSIQDGEDIEKTKKLIEDGADVNEEDESGNTSVYYFMRYSKNESVLDELLKADLKLEEKNHKGNTPLIEGIKMRFPEDNLVSLIKNDANVNAKDKDGIIVGNLFVQCFNYDLNLFTKLKIFIELKNRNADFDDKDINNSTLLMNFISNKDNIPKDITIRLIKCVKDVNVKDKKGFTALHYFAKFGGSKDILNELLDKDPIINLNMKGGKNNHTPLIHAICSKNKYVAKELINAGANVDEKEANGNTALHYCINNGGYNTELYKLLISSDYKLDPSCNLLDISNAEGKTPRKLIKEIEGIEKIEEIEEKK